MKTLVAPEKRACTDGDLLLHGAHVECQIDLPMATMVCGVVSDWSGLTLSSDKDDCIVCYTTLVCPLCGARLKREP